MTMSKGEKAILTISPDYGYGVRGVPPMYLSFAVPPCSSIPGNSTLVFEVELLDIM